MLDSFKAVLEKERIAEKIILEAKEQAEKIKINAQERAEAVYNQTYQDAITKAEHKSKSIKEQAKTEAESEAQIFIKRAEKQKKKITLNAEQKFDELVNSILQEILS